MIDELLTDARDIEIDSLKEKIDNTISYLEKCKDGFATLNIDYILKLLGKGILSCHTCEYYDPFDTRRLENGNYCFDCDGKSKFKHKDILARWTPPVPRDFCTMRGHCIREKFPGACASCNKGKPAISVNKNDQDKR